MSGAWAGPRELNLPNMMLDKPEWVVHPERLSSINSVSIDYKVGTPALALRPSQPHFHGIGRNWTYLNFVSHWSSWAIDVAGRPSAHHAAHSVFRAARVSRGSASHAWCGFAHRDIVWRRRGGRGSSCGRWAPSFTQRARWPRMCECPRAPEPRLGLLPVPSYTS